MTPRIVAANFRDLSYIAGRLRDDDQAEMDASLGPVHPVDLAAMHFRDRAYVVLLDGNPEAAFGAARILGDHLWVAWSWGSRHMRRCAPIIARFVREDMIGDIAGQGAQRVEARSMAAHRTAGSWLLRMGATRRCDLPSYGRGGEDFVLYDWTRKNHA